MKQGIANRINAARGDMNLTELAARCGVDRGGLSRILKGRTHPSVPTLLQIARVLNVPVERLLYPRARGIGGKTFKHIDRRLPEHMLPLPVRKARRRNRRELDGQPTP